MLSRKKKSSHGSDFLEKGYRSASQRFRSSSDKPRTSAVFSASDGAEGTGNSNSKPTKLNEVPLHFIIETLESKQEVYEQFSFATNEKFTISVDPYSALAFSCSAYICFYTTPLGPHVEKGSFTSRLCTKLGPKFQQKVHEKIENEYFGEVPNNTAFCIDHTFPTGDEEKKTTSANTPKQIRVFFVLMDEENPLHAYHGFRSAILNILEAKLPVRTANVPREVVSTSSSQVREFWGSIDRGASRGSNMNAALNSSKESPSPRTRPISGMSGSSQITRSSSNNSFRVQSIAIVIPHSNRLSEYAVVNQMANAYNSLLYFPSSTLPDPAKINAKYEYLTTVSNRVPTEDEVKARFQEQVRLHQLLRRGIIGDTEKEWLLHWIGDSSNPELQTAAAVEFVAYTQSKRNASPIDIPEHVLLRDLFLKANCLSAILKMAEDGTISFHKEISEKSLQKQNEIGKGGTSTVYVAKYQDQLVALKIFDLGFKLEEFRREVAMMELLNNDHLVNIIGAGFTTKEKLPFIVSEYVAKGDLYTLLHVKKIRPSQELIYQWALDISTAMRYLHEHSVLHRDLKSLNILVTDDDHCKIIDYGASKVMTTDSNMTGNVGTLSWMAPEMFQTNSYTEKVDVYSFGIVLYELITGEVPYSNENSFSIPVLVTKGLRPTIPKTVAKPWAKFMAQCWHEKPSRRPTFSVVTQQIISFSSQKIPITETK